MSVNVKGKLHSSKSTKSQYIELKQGYIRISDHATPNTTARFLEIIVKKGVATIHLFDKHQLVYTTNVQRWRLLDHIDTYLNKFLEQCKLPIKL